MVVVARFGNTTSSPLIADTVRNATPKTSLDSICLKVPCIP
jgi:hypothetical protein